MSGHSKWATIKRKKAATDAKRSNMFAKLLRAVEVAAREGGGRRRGNMTLASAVEKAKSFSVPTDNIERAIKRGTGELDDGRAVRGARVRGLRARRRRAARRDAHRQPQPHRPGDPPRVHPHQRRTWASKAAPRGCSRARADRRREEPRSRRGAAARDRARGRGRGSARLPRARGRSSRTPARSSACARRSSRRASRSPPRSSR